MGEINKNNIQANSAYNHKDEIDLLDLFFFYLSKIKSILVVTILAALVAGLFTKFAMTPTYTASTQIYMVSASSGSVVDLTDLNLGTSLSEDYEVLLKVRPIYESTIQRLNLPYTCRQLQGMTTISVVGNSRVLKLSVETTDPVEAKNIVNTLADVSIDYLPEIMETSAPHVAEKAIVPENKTGPSTSKNTALGGLVGLVIMLGIYTVKYLLDDTLKTSSDIEKEFGVLPLATIPDVYISGLRDTRSEKNEKGIKNKLKRMF